MYIDYKATVWFRIPIKDDSKETFDKCIDMLTAGHTPNELYDEMDEELGGCEILYDTEEFLYPEDNDDQCTIEAYVDDKKVWDNYLNVNAI